MTFLAYSRKIQNLTRQKVQPVGCCRDDPITALVKCNGAGREPHESVEQPETLLVSLVFRHVKRPRTSHDTPGRGPAFVIS